MTALTQRIAILGAGTAGTIMANRLAKMYKRRIADGRMTITVVDQDDVHIYQPGLLLLPFGMYTKEEVEKPRRRQVSRAVEYLQAKIDRVEADSDVVHLEDGRTIPTTS